MRPTRAFIILVALAVALGGCYLPSDFKAELTIARDGEFHMRYVGDFADSTILTKLAKNELTPEEEEERAATLFRDLARDPGFTQIFYKGDAYFEVTYDVRGNIFFDKTLTFVRQSDRIVTLAYVERTAEITMRGGTVPPFREPLLELGYDMQGELRVITDANVIEHNANQVTGEDQKTYLWIIQDMDSPSPKLVIGEGEPGA